MAYDLVDSLLSAGGEVTAWVRVSRLLEMYCRKLERSLLSWKETKRELEKECGQLMRASEVELAQLRRWGLVRLLPDWEAAWQCRQRRGRIMCQMADAAIEATSQRLVSAKQRARHGDTSVLTDGFCSVTPAAVAAAGYSVGRFKAELRSLDEEDRRRTAALLGLRPRLARKQNRGELLVEARDMDDFEEIVNDEREREGRLLARWLERSRDSACKPGEIRAFANYMAAAVAALLPVRAEEQAIDRVKGATLSVVLRRAHGMLVTAERRSWLATTDADWCAARGRLADKLATQSPHETAQWLACNPRLVVDSAATSSLLDGLDEDDPTLIAERLTGALNRLHDDANEALNDSVSADDLLPALALALLSTTTLRKPYADLYLAKTYADKTPELDYFLTTFDAALAVIRDLAAEVRTSQNGCDDNPIDMDRRRSFDGANFRSTFGFGSEENDDEDDICIMKELGDWINAQVAMEETMQLLSKEGWVS